MDTFFLVSAIFLTFSFLIAVYRLNARLISVILESSHSFLTDRLLPWLNTVGKWLTLLGGVATFPLVMGLIFFSESSVKWIVNLGLTGCLALIVAAVLLISTFLGICITRHIQVKRILLGLFRLVMTNSRSFFREKTLWACSVGGLLISLVLFVPFFEQLVGGVIYLFGLVFIARLELVDPPNGEDTDNGGGVMALTRSLNYATGKWDDGCQPGGMY